MHRRLVSFFVVFALVGCDGRIDGGRLPAAPVESTPEEGPLRTDCTQPAPPGRRLLWRVTAAQYQNLATALVTGRVASALTPPTVAAVGELPFADEPSLGRYSGQPVGATVQEAQLAPLLTSASTAGTLAVAALKRRNGHCVQQGYRMGLAACLRQTLQERAPIVQGRALEPAALDAIVRDAAGTVPTLSNDEAMALGLSSLLTSPYALFRRELSPALSGEDIAMAMAFALTDAPPDEALWAAATSGALATEDGRRAQLDRLFAEPERLPALARFLEEHFRYTETRLVAKDPAKFRFHDSPRLVVEARRLVSHLLDTAATRDFLKETLTTRVAFVSQTTAPSYGLTAAAIMAPSSTQAVQAQLGPERAGLLTHPALLSAFSHTDETDPVKRGHFVSESLLCVKVPPLPIGVVPALPDLGPNATPRDRLRVHSQDSCWGCHQLMDPIGLGMEDFDHTGRVQARDASGQLVGTGTPLDQPFTGTAALAANLASSPLVHACFAQHLHAFISGAQPVAQDRCTAREAADASLEAGGDLRPVIAAWFSSPTFLTRQETP